MRLFIFHVLLLLAVWDGCLAQTKRPPGWKRNRMQEILNKVTDIQSRLDKDREVIQNTSQLTHEVLKEVKECDEKLGSLLGDIEVMLDEKLGQVQCCEGEEGGDRLVKLEDNYTMIFRITPGIMKSALSRYRSVNKNDDSDSLVFKNVPEGCKTTDGRRYCDRHYRSRILDLWDSLPIDKVRVGVYKNNIEQQFFEFRAQGSDYMNWFRQDRIINDTFDDLTATEPTRSTPNFFSIEGDDFYKRVMFINNHYGGCFMDSGWLVVSDRVDPYCDWEKGNMTHNTFPNIFYPVGKELTKWNDLDNLATADVLVISVKMKDSLEEELKMIDS